MCDQNFTLESLYFILIYVSFYDCNFVAFEPVGPLSICISSILVIFLFHVIFFWIISSTQVMNEKVVVFFEKSINFFDHYHAMENCVVYLWKKIYNYY